MIGVDTNVLVRFFVEDEASQVKKVNQLFALCEKEGKKIFVNKIVLCELVWVLTEIYKYKKNELVQVLWNMCDVTLFEIEDAVLVKVAIQLFVGSRADFADCMLVVSNQRAGCLKTVTFDKKASLIPEFKLL